MIEYSKVNAKLSDTQLKKLKTAVKDKIATTLRISLKIFYGNDLPHELLLTTRQNTKLRNTFNNNMSTDLKLSIAQISKIIQSGGFLGSLLSKLAGPLIKVAILLAKNVLDPLLVGDEFIHLFLAVLPPLPSIFSALLEDSAKVSF